MCFLCNVKQKPKIKQLSTCAVSHAIESIDRFKKVKTDSLLYQKQHFSTKLNKFSSIMFSNQCINCFLKLIPRYKLLDNIQVVNLTSFRFDNFMHKSLFFSEWILQLAKHWSPTVHFGDEIISTVYTFISMLLRIVSIYWLWKPVLAKICNPKDPVY